MAFLPMRQGCYLVASSPRFPSLLAYGIHSTIVCFLVIDLLYAFSMVALLTRRLPRTPTLASLQFQAKSAQDVSISRVHFIH